MREIDFFEIGLNMFSKPDAAAFELAEHMKYGDISQQYQDKLHAVRIKLGLKRKDMNDDGIIMKRFYVSLTIREWLETMAIFSCK